MPTQIHDEAADDLMLALGTLVRRVRSVGAEASRELSWTQVAVMARLDREGPTTTAELARAEGVKPQSMGAVIAGLEEAGIVERRPHPTDGRQVIVALTEKGLAVRKTAGAAKRAWLARAIEGLDESERRNVPAVTAIIRHLGGL